MQKKLLIFVSLHCLWPQPVATFTIGAVDSLNLTHTSYIYEQFS